MSFHFSCSVTLQMFGKVKEKNLTHIQLFLTNKKTVLMFSQNTKNYSWLFLYTKATEFFFCPLQFFITDQSLHWKLEKSTGDTSVHCQKNFTAKIPLLIWSNSYTNALHYVCCYMQHYILHLTLLSGVQILQTFPWDRADSSLVETSIRAIQQIRLRVIKAGNYD